jgi:hypothetical protein
VTAVVGSSDWTSDVQLATVPNVALIIAAVIRVRQAVAGLPVSMALASLVIAAMSFLGPEDGGRAVGAAGDAVGAALLLAALSLPPLPPQPAVNATARIVGPSTRMTVSL